MAYPETYLLGALLAVAASADVAARRIPNVIPTCIACAGLAAVVVRGGVVAGAASVATGVLATTVLLLAWRARLLGGGDAKLAAACILWLGPGRLSTFLLATAVAGGFVAALSLVSCVGAARAASGRVGACVSAASVRTGRSNARTVPYGTAIAVGAMYAVLR